MFSVDSVFVIATRRGSYPVLDLFNSIRWSCQSSFYVVVVDCREDVEFPPEITQGFTVLTAGQEIEAEDGFMRGAGIRWAIDKGIRCKQFVLLDDACLLLQPGLDVWALERMQKSQVGLIGVVDRLSHEDAFKRCTPLMDVWNMPHSNFEPGACSVHAAALFLSASAAATLYQQNLLVPDDCGQWPIPFGPFISWAVQMYGYYMVGWGHMDKQLPPLFVSHTDRSRFLPAPHILSAKFGLYYSLRHVPGYSEEDLREMFKKMRGEDVETSKQFGSAVFGQPPV